MNTYDELTPAAQAVVDAQGWGDETLLLLGADEDQVHHDLPL
jgi:hypothetical protein